MKFRKLVFECGIIAASAVIISGSSAVSVSAAETATETVTTESEQDETESKDSKENENTSDSDVQETDGEATDEDVSEGVAADADGETSEWDNQLLVIVDEGSSLNVREAASTDSEVVGKMYRGSAAEVVEKGDEWTKIVSGDVEGYVNNAYCVFAEEAEAKAAEICDIAATVTTDGVRLRSEAGTDSTIYCVLSEGDSLTAAETEEEADAEWIAVEYGEAIAYVSSDYVDVELEVGEAVSMEEIYEQKAAEAAKKAAEAAAASAASSTSSSDASASSSSGTAVSASSDDTTLLAALIQCEAGGESYAGQLAVGAVVMNRVKSGSFPNSISGVIYQSGQFSPASSGKLSRVLSSGSISSSCYQAAQAAIAGEDNTGGAKYFHAGSGSGTVIGNQVFY